MGEGALVSVGGDSLTSSITVANSVTFDLDGDTNNDLLFAFFGQGNLIGRGLGTASFAGALDAGNFIVTAYDASSGFTIGPATTFGGNDSGSPSFGDFATESSPIGEWAGGEDAYFGFVFQIAGEDHYGYGRLVYTALDPVDPLNPSLLTSSLSVSELVYESTPGTAVTVVPEPSAVLLGGLGFFGMLLRRKR